MLHTLGTVSLPLPVQYTIHLLLVYIYIYLPQRYAVHHHHFGLYFSSILPRIDKAFPEHQEVSDWHYSCSFWHTRSEITAK